MNVIVLKALTQVLDQVSILITNNYIVSVSKESDDSWVITYGLNDIESSDFFPMWLDEDQRSILMGDSAEDSDEIVDDDEIIYYESEDDE